MKTDEWTWLLRKLKKLTRKWFECGYIYPITVLNQKVLKLINFVDNDYNSRSVPYNKFKYD